jgi:PPOX class probable F420-dependent enzyme
MPVSLPRAVENLLAEQHIGILTTCRPDGSPHMTPVRFTWDGHAGLARVMTIKSRRKVQNILANPGGRVGLCQLMGYRWITLEGTGTVTADPQQVAEGERRYAARYGARPPDLPGLVVIEVAVDRQMGQY